jgi:hypothetical protein
MMTEPLSISSPATGLPPQFSPSPSKNANPTNYPIVRKGIL